MNTTHYSVEEIATRIIGNGPDAILFSVSGRAALESVRQSVLHMKRVENGSPLICLGGSFIPKMEADEDVTGIDLIADDARTVLRHLADKQRAGPDISQ